MSSHRRALVFPCGTDQLVGILHVPERPGRIGVVVVVGGPQYRVGSHRQFVHLADDLAASGYPTLRFDYRGMGDSEGPCKGFEAVGDDIAAAVSALRQEQPAVAGVILWGLCDAATAAAFYAGAGGQVAGLVLANPWVRTIEGLARSYVENYYGQRLLDPGFWRRLLTGRMPVWQRLREFLGDWRSARRGSSAALPASLPERTRQALHGFSGPVLLLMSGADLTAGEFDACIKGKAWEPWRARSSVTRVDLPAADHTFSRHEWRMAVSEATVRWLGGLPR
jgi:exosortase A-associated hydrolase 1